jgi:hypothetical protein
MPLPYDTEWSEAIERRFQCVAGPFLACEAEIFHNALHHLRVTGARVLVVLDGPWTVNLYRPRGECETIDETAERLQRIGKLPTGHKRGHVADGASADDPPPPFGLRRASQ